MRTSCRTCRVGFASGGHPDCNSCQVRSVQQAFSERLLQLQGASSAAIQSLLGQIRETEDEAERQAYQIMQDAHEQCRRLIEEAAAQDPQIPARPDPAPIRRPRQETFGPRLPPAGQREAQDPDMMPRLAPGQAVHAVMVDLVTTRVRNKRPECAICFEPFTRAGKFAELECGHIFHEECLAEWTAREKTCPMCRRQIC